MWAELTKEGQQLITWGLVGFMSGVAKMLNTSLNDKSVLFRWQNILARGFVGTVCGMTAAYVVNIKYDPSLAVPAASVFSWFSSEAMLIVEIHIKRKLRKLKLEEEKLEGKND